MKRFLIVTMTCLAAHARAQTGGGPLRVREPQQLKQDSREAAEKLGAARKSGVTEGKRLSEAGARDGVMAEKAKQAAADLLLAPDGLEAATAKRADASMADALKNVTEEGKAMLSRSAARGPTTAPPRPGTIMEENPKPGPLEPVSIEDPAVPGSKVIITCTGAAFFDSATSIALFTENVEVRHPQFFVLCDEFEVHMVKEEKPKPGEAPKAGDSIKDPIKEPVNSGVGPAAQPGADSGIKFAIARGRMVTIEKLTETGEVQVGHAKHATYEGATGNILLRDFPQVQRGQHIQIATDPSTTMVLKQNGALDTKGPSRTEIIQEASPKSAPRPVAPPQPASPNPNASPGPPRQ